MRSEIALGVLAVVLIGGNAWWTSHSLTPVKDQLRRLELANDRPAHIDTPLTTCAVSLDREVLRSEAQKAFSGLCSAPAEQLPAHAPADVAAAAQAENAEMLAPNEETIKSLDKVNALIERGLARRNWSADDVSSLRPLMAQLDPQSRDEVAHRLVRALNDGKIEFTGRPGELF